MSDILSKEERSALMARVRTSGTTPEMYVRRVVWHSGFRYRLNVPSLPGRPDIVFPRYKTVALVQGCFWHGHECCKGQKRPVTNRDFWNKKLDGNIARDAANRAKLLESGWKVITIWECQLHENTLTLVTHLESLRDANRRGSQQG